MNETFRDRLVTILVETCEKLTYIIDNPQPEITGEHARAVKAREDIARHLRLLGHNPF